MDEGDFGDGGSEVFETRETLREREGERERERDRETEKQRDRETEKQKQTPHTDQVGRQTGR